MKCIEFFTEHFGNTKVCKLLLNIDNEILIHWESEKAIKCSPCPVSDDEVLVRQIFTPIHYDEESNEFTATAFTDAEDKGLSVNRSLYISQEEIYNLADNRVAQYNEKNPEKPKRSFPGIVKFNCAEVRLITVQSNSGFTRGLVVYDTAYEADISHADIFQILKEKAFIRSVRSQLRDLANKYLAANPFN